MPRATSLWTAVVLLTAVFAVAWPILSADWLPFVDYPEHLSTVAVLHGSSEAAYSPYFVVEYARTQYLLVYVLGDLFAYMFGVEGAGRVVTLLSLAGLPLGLALFLREHGRPPMLGALAAAPAIHAFAFWGFLNYCAGLALALVSLAALARLVRQPNARNAIFYSLACVLTFYAHAQAYAFMAFASLVQVLAMSPAVGWVRTKSAVWRAAAAALPSIGAVAFWVGSSRVLERGVAGDRSGLAARVTDRPPRFAPVHETVSGWLDQSFGVYSDGAGAHIAVAFVLALVALIAIRGMAWGRFAVADAAPGEHRSTRDTPLPTWLERFPPLAKRFARFVKGRPVATVRSFAPEAVLGFAIACYLFAPVSYRLIEPINHRFLPLALGLAAVLGPIALGSLSWRLPVGVGLMVLCLFVGNVHASHFQQTDEEMGRLDAALEQTGPGKRLLGLIYDRQSTVVRFPTYLHAHQYYQARVGGLASFGFVEFPISPIQYRQGAEPPPFPARFEWTPQSYRHDVYGDYFDYILVRHAPNRRPPRIFPVNVTPEVRFRGVRWTLYQLSQGR